jgi:hypothetical protein
MNIKDNIIYFDSDNEFYEYSVVPELVPVQYIDSNGNEKYYSDFNFTPQYNAAINNNMRFVIKDEDSQIYKHGCVSYRTISKDIQNLDPWFDDYD